MDEGDSAAGQLARDGDVDRLAELVRLQTGDRTGDGPFIATGLDALDKAAHDIFHLPSGGVRRWIKVQPEQAHDHFAQNVMARMELDFGGASQRNCG